MKILLGGIPLGCDNIGDEAILSCSVDIMRTAFPGASVTVCTADKSTGGLLGVEVAPLFGFSKANTPEKFAEYVKDFDLFVWTGATGLSDYPQVAISLLERAHSVGVKTLVWGVGMDSELNPAFFKVGGRRRFVLKLMSGMTLGLCDFVSCYERRKVAAMRRKIGETLERCCSAVIVRDPQTKAELEKCSYMKAVVGADSAILLKSVPQHEVECHDGRSLIGVCVSAQRALSSQDGFARFLDSLLDEDSRRDIVFIPMNPKTDYALMGDILSRMKHGGDRARCVSGLSRPGMVQDAVSKCACVISSRLHLLILSGNVSTPVIGIRRGSKLDNYLANFSLVPCGSVSDCDYDAIRAEVAKFLSPEGSSSFKVLAEAANASLRARLFDAVKILSESAE